MSGKWFQTRGEAIRTVVATAAGCGTLYLVLKQSGLL